ncbi:MAG: hypothetical protein PF443_10105 [Allgaiera sp.]|jgi:hypothetical protein|nr:hypothetical protein [Allgaiera sp.]
MPPYLAAITPVCTIEYVAKMLSEDPELLEAIIANDDNLSYSNIVSDYPGPDKTITAITDDGIEELSDMLADARRSAENWRQLPRRLRLRPGRHCSCQGPAAAVATRWLLSAGKNHAYAATILS